MTFEQYQDYVNTYIATNGRNAITGNVMNTILQEIGQKLFADFEVSSDANNQAELGSDNLTFIGTIAASGVVIDFTKSKIFNSPASPGSGNVTDNLTGAKIGVVQKIYHNDATEPTFPAGWVRIGSTEYTTSVLNIIYAEWVSGTRVEYWIVQEA